MEQKTTLRAQWNSRKGCWRIVKKTDNGCGGWKLFSSYCNFTTRHGCEDQINKLVKKYPDHYQAG